MIQKPLRWTARVSTMDRSRAASVGRSRRAKIMGFLIRCRLWQDQVGRKRSYWREGSTLAKMEALFKGVDERIALVIKWYSFMIWRAIWPNSRRRERRLLGVNRKDLVLRQALEREAWTSGRPLLCFLISAERRRSSTARRMSISIPRETILQRNR